MARVKPGGWATNEKILSAQATQLDTNVDALDTLTRDVGVRRQRTYTSTALLRAATDYAHGDIVFVANYGPYRFDSASTFNGTMFERPDNIMLASPGRWVSALNGWYGTAFGLAALDDFARLPAATVRRGLIDRKTAYRAASYTVTDSEVLVSSTSMTTDVNVAVGDEIVVAYDMQLEASGLFTAVCKLQYGAGPMSTTGLTRRFRDATMAAHVVTRFIAASTGVVTVALFVAKESGPATSTIEQVEGELLVRRP